MSEIIFYKTSNGKCPIVEFLDSLSGRQTQKIAWVLELFEETNILSKKNFKKLSNTNDIWEFRVIYEGDSIRLLGFFDSGDFVLTNGFVKKNQKTPRSSINIAETRKRIYLERFNK